MLYKLIIAFLLWSEAAYAASLSVTINFVAGSGATVSLSNNRVVTKGTSNTGMTVGSLIVTTSPPGGIYTGTVTLSGTDAAKFSLTNGGRLPSNLVVGPNDLVSGAYSITLIAN